MARSNAVCSALKCAPKRSVWSLPVSRFRIRNTHDIKYRHKKKYGKIKRHGIENLYVPDLRLGV
jgi:hypothetical protein